METKKLFYYIIAFSFLYTNECTIKSSFKWKSWNRYY